MKTNSTPLEAEITDCHNSDRNNLISVVQDLRDALYSASQLSQEWLAWEKLNIRDVHGVNRVIPYTSEAIETLERAYVQNESDCDLIHHLAIAYHAMAWDIELVEPGTASTAWKKALFYWRKLQACRTFWDNLCVKGEMLGDTFNRSVVEEFRKNLIQHLLEIHVYFICHYYELKKPDQASQHIELIKEAQISPADRKAFENLVYDAMTSTVLNVVNEGLFNDALTILDGFLNMFPFYLPALQRYLEISRQWIDQMSPSTQLKEINEVDIRVLPRWEALNAMENIFKYPFALTAMCELSRVLGRKYLAWAKSLRFQRTKANKQPHELESEEYQGYNQAISWLKKSENQTSDNSSVQFDLFNALMFRSEYTFIVGIALSEFDMTCQLLDQALSDCQEAMKVAPGEKASREFAAKLLQIRAEYIGDLS